MRVLILIAFLAIGQTAFGKVANLPRSYQDALPDIIECVRKKLTAGLPDYGLPGFDPLKIVDHTFNFADFGLEGVTGELNVQDLTFSGLMDFVASDLSGSIEIVPPSYNVKATLIFPKPILSTKYVNELNGSTINTFGDGTLDFVANNFTARVDIKATIYGGGALDHFSIFVSMDPLSEFVITGVHNDEAYSQEVSARILADGHNIIAQANDIINEIASEVIMNVFDHGDDDDQVTFLCYLIGTCVGP